MDYDEVLNLYVDASLEYALGGVLHTTAHDVVFAGIGEKGLQWLSQSTA